MGTASVQRTAFAAPWETGDRTGVAEQRAYFRSRKDMVIYMRGKGTTGNVVWSCTWQLIVRNLIYNNGKPKLSRDPLADMKAFEKTPSLLHKYIWYKILVTFHLLKRYKFVWGLPGHAASGMPPQSVTTMPALLVTEPWQTYCYDVMFQINKTWYFMYFK